MVPPNIADLKQALREIRGAAKKLRTREWAAATELRYVIEDRLEVVSRAYDLHVLFQTLSGEVNRACLSRLATYREVHPNYRRPPTPNCSHDCSN